MALNATSCACGDHRMRRRNDAANSFISATLRDPRQCCQLLIKKKIAKWLWGFTFVCVCVIDRRKGKSRGNRRGRERGKKKGKGKREREGKWNLTRGQS